MFTTVVGLPFSGVPMAGIPNIVDVYPYGGIFWFAAGVFIVVHCH